MNVRAKSAWLLFATLAVGVVLGVLGASTLQNRRADQLRETRERGGVTRFFARILQTEGEALNADVRRAIEEGEERFRRIRAQCGDSLGVARSAMMAQLDTLLTPEQQELLQQYRQRTGQGRQDRGRRDSRRR